MGNVLPAEIITDIMPFATPADTMSFTGRRPKDLCGYEASAYCQFVSDLTEVLSIFYSKGVRRFLSGGAQGMDQLAFWAIQRLKTAKDCTDVKMAVNITADLLSGYTDTSILDSR